MGCSLQKKLKEQSMTEQQINEKIMINPIGNLRWIKLGDVYRELGVVAQKIRDKIDEAKKDHTRYKQRRDATDSIAAKRNYDELQLITRGYINALHDVLGLLVEDSKEKGK